MIRIDEIYNHTFWPWIEHNLPGTRMFFCDPFGHTRPENLFNHGSDLIQEANYIFFHDQEPIQIEAHKELFDDVVRRNLDIKPSPRGRVVVSEKGNRVRELCDIYGWQSSYYFFHGWACLDWYRGYDRTFLFAHPEHRPMPQQTFMSANRIIGGQRDHRVLFAYHCIKKNLSANNISCADICPVENVSIETIANRYSNTYPDIEQVISSAELPWLFPGEQTQKMTSCWLDNFHTAMSSMIYVPTETVFFGRRTHLTEKTFKAIALGMPFVLIAPVGSLAYLREYGFQTFGSVWDESYDEETDDLLRLDRATDLLREIDQLSDKEKQQIWKHCLPVVLHNWNHFYQGGLEKILWQELTCMLESIHV
jgi:hypothetical protein